MRQAKVVLLTLVALAAWALPGAVPAPVAAQQLELPAPIPPLTFALRASEAKGGVEGAVLAPRSCTLDDIHCGETKQGKLEGGDCLLDDGTLIDFWTFHGNAGTTVTIDLMSSAFDAVLFLLDPSPAVVAMDDDGGAGTNSRIAYTLGQSGTWTIGANSLLPDTGNYSLRLQCSGSSPGQPPAAPSNLVATTSSDTEIHLTWNDNSSNESTFRVEVRTGGGSFQEIGSVGANVTAVNVTGLSPGTAYSFRVRARNAAGDSAYSNVATATTSSGTGWFTSSTFPGYRFRVVFSLGGGSTISGTKEAQCLPETVCVSGSIPGRSELFIRIVGPKPNGYMWPTLVKFSTSQIDVWIEQTATSVMRHYTLEGASPGSDDLSGMFDRTGFLP